MDITKFAMNTLKNLNKKKEVLEQQIKKIKDGTLPVNHHPRLITDIPTLEKELVLIENEIQNLNFVQ